MATTMSFFAIQCLRCGDGDGCDGGGGFVGEESAREACRGEGVDSLGGGRPLAISKPLHLQPELNE